MSGLIENRCGDKKAEGPKHHNPDRQRLYANGVHFFLNPKNFSLTTGPTVGIRECPS